MTIDTDDFDVLEGYDDYDNEHKDAKHRRWGRMSWLHPGDLVIQIGDASAATIRKAMKHELEQLHAIRARHERQR